jgi:hypothetical protein
MIQQMILGLAAAALLTGVKPASAEPPQPKCAPRAVVVERLASKYGETQQSIGLGTNNAMVEVFASSNSGSWTITVTSATGITCLVASGLAFETLAEVRRIPGKDA